jgi:hypothetical protein
MEVREIEVPRAFLMPADCAVTFAKLRQENVSRGNIAKAAWRCCADI